MKFLIDNNLSPLIAQHLAAAGHDAVHLRDYGLQAAPDPAVLALARTESRVVVSADTDFGALMARKYSRRRPSLLIRRIAGRRAADQASIILANLETIEHDLDAGAVVVLTDDSLRIRACPSPDRSRLSTGESADSTAR
jgi:predicted nuclease of predicted toxin-antitoxin system